MESKENKTLIFCSTKRTADDITRYLRQDGWPALAIHGDKAQQERDWVLAEFKSGRSPIMVATDVASRGIGMSLFVFLFLFSLRFVMVSCCPLTLSMIHVNVACSCMKNVTVCYFVEQANLLVVCSCACKCIHRGNTLWCPSSMILVAYCFSDDSMLVFAWVFLKIYEFKDCISL